MSTYATTTAPSAEHQTLREHLTKSRAGAAANG